MRVFCLIFCLSGFYQMAAQTPAYLHYSVRDGLPGNFVHCGLQDRRGLLWFGTDKGLACFDGLRFRVYGVRDGLPDPEVLNIQEDSQGRLWLFCFRKKPCYMLHGRIITEKDDALLADIDFTTGTYSLSEEPAKGIWFTEASKKTYFVSGNKVAPFNFPAEVARFQQVGDAFLILGTHSIMRFTPDGDIDLLYQMPPAAGHPSIGVSGNRILYAFPGALVLFEWNNGHIRKLDELKQPTGQVYTDHLNRFWVCSPAQGAVLFDNYSGALSRLSPFLTGKKVNRVFEDAQNNLWFCTVNEGIYALQQHAPTIFQQAFGFPSLNIRSLARDSAGNLFVGDDAGNINILTAGKLKTLSVGSVDGYNLIRQMIPDTGNMLWTASDEGLFRYDSQRRTLHEIPVKGSLKSIFMQQKRLWIAAATTLSYLHKETAENRVLIQQRFTAVGADADENIWAGGIDGIYSERDSFQINWGDRFPELKNRIMAIHSAGGDQLWVVTAKDGLLSATVTQGKVKKVESLNRRLASPIDNIQSLFVEPGGRIWLATNRGIYGIDKAFQVVHYNALNGLADDDVNAVLVHQDTLWAGTVSGLSRVVLRQPEETGNFKTYIMELRYELNKQMVSFHLLDSAGIPAEIKLPPAATMLELNLTGLDYRARGNFRFELVQTEHLLPVYWWTPGNLFEALFSGLKPGGDTTMTSSGAFSFGVHVPPGRYHLRVTAVHPSGVRSRHPDQLWLLVRPYWYETVWLYLAVWGLITFAVWRIYRARMAYREINAAASALQLQALQSQMNPHFIGNTVNAIQQFLHPPNPEKTSEYIALFVRLLRRTMDFSENTFIPFDAEIAYVNEYMKLVQLRFGNKFRYELVGLENIPPGTLIPSMLLQPILENATIHGLAPDGESILRLEFFLRSGRLHCVLEDNGIGMKATQQQKQLDGIDRNSKGLELLQKKVLMLNRLYGIDLRLNMEDLSDLDSRLHGTRITFTYFPDSIWKSKAHRPTPAK
ncbi:MAG: histidine kinase [Saprospirales bacterium]|nr:histidine kinase [Saprospirales bacterium]